MFIDAHEMHKEFSTHVSELLSAIEVLHSIYIPEYLDDLFYSSLHTEVKAQIEEELLAYKGYGKTPETGIDQSTVGKVITGINDLLASVFLNLFSQI